MGDHNVCPSCGGQSLGPPLDGCAEPKINHAAYPRLACPDDGRCWHGCPIVDGKGIPCWRVNHAEPFTDQYPDEKDGVWPFEIRDQHRPPSDLTGGPTDSDGLPR